MNYRHFFIAILIITLLSMVSCAPAEPTEADKKEDMIDNVIAYMTLEEKVGQMFMGCFQSGMPETAAVAEYKLGGILLFRSTFEEIGPEYFETCTDSINEAFTLDPVIAVDEEGGTVVRVSASPYYRSAPFKSPRRLYEEGGIDAIIADTHEKNQLLSSLGINMNLAPVCDISMDPGAFMYDRSLGQDAKVTSQYVSAVVNACRDDKMGTCLKHFPGYGNTSDTHQGIATDSRAYKEFKKSDFKPFEAGIEAGASCVLVSHNTVTSIDPDRPASLSRKVIDILREDLGYDGVVITDDLSMGAITQSASETDCAILAVKAGNDILCSGAYKVQIPAVIQAVNDGTITEKRINKSVRRILQMKLDLGIITKSQLEEIYVESQ